MGAFGAPVSAADFPQKAGILGPGRQCCPTRLALVARRILSGREQTGKGYASKEAQGEEESVIVEAVMADNEAHSGKQTAIVSAEERQRLRLPDESAQAFSGFCAYLDVKPGKRSIAAAY